MSNIQSTILGFPRMGRNREIKKALESYWKGNISSDDLDSESKKLRKINIQTQIKAGIQEIPVGDFSLYDHVLDLTFALGVIPDRYSHLKNNTSHDVYFAMARGEKGSGNTATAMEMSKWFDTNYHYIVPEFHQHTTFTLLSHLNILRDIKEAQTFTQGTDITIRPVLVGPLSYLLLGKMTDGTHQLQLLPKLLDTYCTLLSRIAETGVTTVQLDEPCLVTDVSNEVRSAFTSAYNTIKERVSSLDIFLATYFDDIEQNLETVAALPVRTVHVDVTRGSIETAKTLASKGKQVSLGIIDGRNIWKSDIAQTIKNVRSLIGNNTDRQWHVSTSCSLLHCPVDLAGENTLDDEIKNWLSFSVQKLREIAVITTALNGDELSVQSEIDANASAIQSRRESIKVHKPTVTKRVQGITKALSQRQSSFVTRKNVQQAQLNLPSLPTTTIGSFPQTSEIRKSRAAFRKGTISFQEYQTTMQNEIKKVVDFQESVGLDVLVHGEPERNDMVEYFGEHFDGFVATLNGWVQSYGSRCVKPPIIYGDLIRTNPITVEWSTYAQSLTNKPMKGMLTGPVTILQWSFVRDDQPRRNTAMQIAFLVREEVQDLEKAGIKIIQVDEPAIREGLPLRKKDHAQYLDWAVESFKISTCGVQDTTQIHTHMCYSEFNEIIAAIAAMDADVISIEASRSRMELLEAFTSFQYPNEIGPGVYDIHSPRIPSVEEMVHLMEHAKQYIPARQLWVNPDCGLKTRAWDEVKLALQNMVEAAKILRIQM